MCSTMRLCERDRFQGVCVYKTVFILRVCVAGLLCVVVCENVCV